MAHNIEIVNGVASFVENGGKECKNLAWHGLGTPVDHLMTANEALELSHANYEVSMQPIVAISPELMVKMANNEPITPDDLLSLMVEGKKATFRNDTNKALGIVSDSYGIVQNADAFKFVDTLCSGNLTSNGTTPMVETAGVLGQGERVFVTCKFPDTIKLGTGDDVEMYMVFTTSHDGTGAVQCMVTPVRVVCENTLNWAMSNNTGKLSLRHSSRIMSRLDVASKEDVEFAYRALNIYGAYKESIEQSFEHLKQIKLAEKELDNILAQVILTPENYKVYQQTGKVESEGISTRNKNQFYGIKNSIESGVGQEFGETGTGMWLLNGISSYYQNSLDYKDDTKKFDNLMSGTASQKLQKAYDLITA